MEGVYFNHHNYLHAGKINTLKKMVDQTWVTYCQIYLPIFIKP